MDDITAQQIAEEMKKSRELPRDHASFFDWHDKGVKEIFVCRILVTYLNNENGENFQSVSAGNDPPDCIALSGPREVAIEVVELVDQKTIENQIKLKQAYPETVVWSEELLTGRLNTLIQGKDNPEKKDELREKFSRYILLIHTDEPGLTCSIFENLFSENKIISTTLIDEVYLLFSHDPGLKCYPVLKIK